MAIIDIPKRVSFYTHSKHGIGAFDTLSLSLIVYSGGSCVEPNHYSSLPDIYVCHELQKFISMVFVLAFHNQLAKSYQSLNALFLASCILQRTFLDSTSSLFIGPANELVCSLFTSVVAFKNSKLHICFGD